MRTTLSVDDDALDLVKKYAENRSIPLGKAVSELVRRGAAAKTPTKIVNGLHVFDLPADSPRISSEKVKQLEEEFG